MARECMQKFRTKSSRRLMWCLSTFLLVVCASSAAHSDPVKAEGNNELERLENTLAVTTDLDILLALAVHNNPSVNAARENWLAKIEKYNVVTGLPDPQLVATYYPAPIETRLGPQDWNLSFSQMLPYPGTLSAKGRMVEKDAEIGRLGMEKAMRDVVAAVRQSFYELLYIQQAIHITKQTTELMDHLRLAAETAGSEDRASLLDIMKAQSQTAQLQYDIMLLNELEQTEKIQLNTLLNRVPSAALGPAKMAPLKEITLAPEEIFQLADQEREEIQIAEAMVHKAEENVNLAHSNNWPDFNVGIFYAGIGDPDTAMPPPDAGKDSFGIKAGFSIPLWFGKNAGRVREAQAEVRQARAQRQEVVNTSRAAIQKTFFRLQNAKRLETLYRQELLPQAARAMETAETWFQEGQGSFSDFIETANTLYNFQLALARAQADSGKFQAQLEQLAGWSLSSEEPPAPDEAVK